MAYRKRTEITSPRIAPSKKMRTVSGGGRGPSGMLSPYRTNEKRRRNEEQVAFSVLSAAIRKTLRLFNETNPGRPQK